MSDQHEQALEMAEKLRAGETIYLARTADPEAMGRIRRVVETAHKWGGDGTKPEFRKIRRVLIAKHPEVIAKAFGGNANVAAAWIKNNWYRLRGRKAPPTTGKGAMHASLALSVADYQEVPLEVFGEDAAELFCATDKPERDGNLVWVTALRTGEWMVNPIPGSKEPLVIDKAFMQEVMTAWNDGAWEYVQVPTYHTDNDPLANTGFVKDLRVMSDRTRKGHHVLRAAIEFTEAAVAQRVENGSIAGVSVNIKFNVTNQETGRLYKKVLTHIALTNIPFINGLKAFAKTMAASTGDVDSNGDIVGSYELVADKEDVWLTELVALAKQAFDVERDYEYVRQQITAQLSKGYYLDPEGDLVGPDLIDTNGEHEGAKVLSPAYVYVMGMTSGEILVCAHSNEAEQPYAHVQEQNGYLRGWVVGYEVSDEGEVLLDPIDEWKAVEKTWVAMSLQFKLFNTQNSHADIPKEDSIDMEATKLEGGEQKMADEPTKVEPKEEVKEEQVTFSKDELDTIAQERAEAVLAAYREEQDKKDADRQAEFSAMRAELHKRTVDEKIAALTSAGHAPAVVKVAHEIMLADGRGEAVLSLSREDGEVKLTATDIVTELLASVPATALEQTEIKLPDISLTPEDSKSRADALYDEIFGKPSTVLSDS